jgi:predicted SAM-dependent methyltransferase
VIGINAGSGQRPFDRTQGWINIDINPKWNPDIVADWNDLSMFGEGSVDTVVSQHSIEHAPCGGAQGFFKEAYRVLRPQGALIITIPDIRALAKRWLDGGISDYIYIVNLMGAYMDSEADRHKWHYTETSLIEALKAAASWKTIGRIAEVTIAGADVSSDWWILMMSAVKE